MTKKEVAVLGIDLGTNKAAACVITSMSPLVYKTWLFDNSKAKTSDERFEAAITAIISKIIDIEPDMLVVEYPFNIMGHGAILIEMFGAIHYRALRVGVNFMPLSQSKIKKYATGAGKAEKSDMRMQLYREYGIDLPEDQTDAFWIAHFGYTSLFGSDKKWRQQSVDDHMKKLKKVSSEKKKK